MKIRRRHELTGSDAPLACPMGQCLGCFESPPAGSPDSAESADSPDSPRTPASVEAPADVPSDRNAKDMSPQETEIKRNGNGKGSETIEAAVRQRAERGERGRRGSGPRRANAGSAADAKINALFDLYRDRNEDAILSEGIERLCEDLQLRPDEFRVLVLAWKLNAEQMCRFSKREFSEGLRGMRVDSIKGVQGRLPEIVAELRNDAELFKDLYRFTFKFGLDAPGGQRILPADVAVALWRLVFTVREPPILNRWLRYLEGHPHVRGIPKDTWHMFLNFCDTVDVDLSSYDDTEAWPSLFDDFVEFENDQMNQNISKNETFKKSD